MSAHATINIQSLIATDTANSFPWQVYNDELVESLKLIAYHNNIPPQYLGAQALFAVAALAGNMYSAYIGGIIKPIIFLAKVGPSGVGKTPAYHKIMGDIISPLRVRYNEEYQLKIKEYRTAQVAARQGKYELEREAPVKRIRIIEGGTVEAIGKHSTTSPAGFGVVYDEGERMFEDLNKYSNGGNSISFWNEAFNGKTVEMIRVDSERERFISAPAISLDISLQSSRMGRYFTQDAIESGILNRFIMVESDAVLPDLNTDLDFFAGKVKVSDEWRSLMIHLFQKGNTFQPDETMKVECDSSARLLFNQFGREMILQSNIIRRNIVPGDASEHISNYRSKLFTYFPRLALILAIMKDARNPLITQAEVFGARDLCNYFEKVATTILRRLFSGAVTGLTDKEQILLDTLPDQFTIQDAEDSCQKLQLSQKFFSTAFRRKYRPGNFVIKLMKGVYEKV